jgi:hypothetical protein
VLAGEEGCGGLARLRMSGINIPDAPGDQRCMKPYIAVGRTLVESIETLHATGRRNKNTMPYLALNA